MFVVVMMVISIPLHAADAADESIKFYLDQNYYEKGSVRADMDAAPYVNSANRTMVPLRFLGNALGVSDDNITWDSRSQMAKLKQGDKTLEFMVDSFSYVADGQIKQMDTVPELTGGRVMLPARYVVEAFGYNVYWVQNAKAVMVTTKTLDTSKPMDVLLVEDITGKNFNYYGDETVGVWEPEVVPGMTWKIDTKIFKGKRVIGIVYYLSKSTVEDYQNTKRIINAFVPSISQEVNKFFDYDIGFVAERKKAHDLTLSDYGDLSSVSKGRNIGEDGYELVNIRNSNSDAGNILITIYRPNEEG